VEIGNNNQEAEMDILVVDDSKVMRSLVQRAIRQAGYRDLEIGEAINGIHALEQLSKESPKLVLSDWNMPEMSGVELLIEIRSKNNKVPFGFITSEASSGIHDLAKQSGANFILTKPFTVDDVHDALSPVLGY
jgi:two-component system chemotaxis response regulator CheY